MSIDYAGACIRMRLGGLQCSLRSYVWSDGDERKVIDVTWPSIRHGIAEQGKAK